ncbi:ATP-binding protein [Streptomyces paludis]|uniref:ATP-binding protein n=1 Tax=Streptomyces paludis TaxID=2282738 RepID=A0A345HXA2_9ACTN|nr:ATP-binding protein [Streptomyces paludis]
MAPGNALTPQLIAALCPGNVVRRYGFRLPAHAESAGRARQLTRDRLGRWELDEETCDTAVLVVSELVTNAIVHAAGHRVMCELREDGGTLRIAVEDQGFGPTGPQLHRTGKGVGAVGGESDGESEGEHGRGLFLVDSLCSGWGAHDTSGYGPGRVVWAELAHGGRPGRTGLAPALSDGLSGALPATLPPTVPAARQATVPAARSGALSDGLPGALLNGVPRGSGQPC